MLKFVIFSYATKITCLVKVLKTQRYYFFVKKKEILIKIYQGRRERSLANPSRRSARLRDQVKFLSTGVL